MNERELFIEALQRADPAERGAYLDSACGGNAVLRAEVENLLEIHAGAGSFLEPPGTPADPRPGSEGPGAMVGQYKLEEQIGEGGFGVVFLAEQTQPVRRKVALKILKPGMDTRQVVARFEAERQALAIMDHPNIARVFDGGATPSGRPYFVMELVKGVPVTDFCDRNHLNPRQRLGLFVTTCQAVQHAHQRGVIHRDLKPSNVLVTTHDAAPVVKVIDFGVAKAVAGASDTVHRLTDKTLLTGLAQMIGTPPYMSPEQAGTSDLDVDTRSDVYSLGVMLYELLTGTTPFIKERFKRAAYAEMCRIIREEEPPKPSTRLAQMRNAECGMRNENPSSIPHSAFRIPHSSDLDWIVMKCLEKDRDRRYETAAVLARDVERYLADEPVDACPPSAGYRLRKFARRHKTAFRATAAFVVVLIVGVVVSTWQAVRATIAEADARAAEGTASAQRDRAVTAEEVARTERDKAVAQKERADEEAAVAKAVADFLQFDLLGEAAPERNPRAKQVTVEVLLGRAAARIDGKFGEQPRIEAAIRQTIGNAYLALGDYRAAQPHMERALDLRLRTLGKEHPDTLHSMNNLGWLYKEQGQLVKAQPFLIEALEVRRRVLGEEHPETVRSMVNLAGLYMARGQYTKAEPFLVRFLEVSPRVLGVDHPDTVTAMSNLGALYKTRDQLAQAEPLLVEAVELGRRTLQEGHPAKLLAMQHLADLYALTNRLDRAVPLFEETLRLMKTQLGPEHPRTLHTMIFLGVSYLDTGRAAEAIPLLDVALERIRKGTGPIPLDLLILPPMVAAAYERAGQFAKAEPLRREALDYMQKNHGTDSPFVVGFLHVLGLNLLHQKRYAEAEPLLRQCLKICETHLPDDWAAFSVRSSLGGSLLGQKKYAEAEPLLLAGYMGLKQREATIPVGNKARLPDALERLVQLYEATGDKEKAAEWRSKREPRKDLPKP